MQKHTRNQLFEFLLQWILGFLRLEPLKEQSSWSGLQPNHNFRLHVASLFRLFGSLSSLPVFLTSSQHFAKWAELRLIVCHIFSGLALTQFSREEKSTTFIHEFCDSLPVTFRNSDGTQGFDSFACLQNYGRTVHVATTKMIGVMCWNYK